MTRARMESFSLSADMMYVSQNAPRICRALFEICLRRGWSTAAEMALTMCKVRPLSLLSMHAGFWQACFVRMRNLGLPSRPSSRSGRMSAPDLVLLRTGLDG